MNHLGSLALYRSNWTVITTLSSSPRGYSNQVRTQESTRDLVASTIAAVGQFVESCWVNLGPHCSITYLCCGPVASTVRQAFRDTSGFTHAQLADRHSTIRDYWAQVEAAYLDQPDPRYKFFNVYEDITDGDLADSWGHLNRDGSELLCQKFSTILHLSDF